MRSLIFKKDVKYESHYYFIISLFELITKAKKHLDQLSYAESTQKNYELIWNHFLEYSDTKGQVFFFDKIGE